MNRLQGKIAIVTGAASGLGMGTAQRLAQEGAKKGALADINGDATQREAAFITGQVINVDGGLLAHQPYYADDRRATAAAGSPLR